MIKILYLIIFLCLIEIRFCATSCSVHVNFCSECDMKTGLCKTCYFDVFIPDKNGGCTGIRECTKEKNFCKKCDSSLSLCQLCDEGYYPDDNGGCSTTENCDVSFQGSCRICKKNYVLVSLGNQYLDCLSLFSERLLNCKEFNGYGRCLECESNFFLNSGDGKCISTENCYTSDSGICNKCNNGYFLDKSDKNKCKYIGQNLNFLYCSESIDGKTCSTCKIGYFMAEDKKCVFSKFCIKAKSTGYYCQECQSGYYFDKNGMTCVITKNCETGEYGTGKCLKCNKNYYLEKSTGKCLSNIEDNDFKYCEYGTDNCEYCINYYYLGEDKKCSTSSNCAKSDNGTCIKCSNDYYLGSLDKRCTKVERCIKSDYYFNCIECELGYYFNSSDYICTSEDKNKKMENCKLTDRFGKNCSLCRDDYYLNTTDYKCYSNEEKGNFYKCSITEFNSCKKCVNGFYLGSLDHKCSSIFGCVKSKTPNQCLECENYFCLNIKKGTCENINWIDEEESGVCLNCKQTNEEGTSCQVCQEDYSLSRTGKCIDSNSCEEVDEKGSCLKCKHNFYNGYWLTSYCLNNEYGCIEGDDEGCLKCDNKYDFTECTECLDGYWLNEDLQCNKCKPGCSTCSNDNNCGKCGYGYYTLKEASDSKSYDAKCAKCSDGCKVCQNKIECIECNKGYFITNEAYGLGDIVCTPCPQGCQECMNSEYCLKCEDGYEIVLSGYKILCQPSN